MPTGIYETELSCVICGAWFKTRNASAKFCCKCKPDSRRFGRVCKQRFMSMATINTVEASYLIEELYQIASEMEIQLDESEF